MCTISIRTKLYLCNCLMQGSPDLKSRLQEAANVSHLAEACRPTGLGPRASEPGRAGAEQSGQHQACPAPGWAKRTRSVSSHLRGRTATSENMQSTGWGHHWNLCGVVQVHGSHSVSHQSGRLGGGLGLCHVHYSCPMSRQLLQSEAPFSEHFPAVSWEHHHLLSWLSDVSAIALPWQQGCLYQLSFLWAAARLPRSLGSAPVSLHLLLRAASGAQGKAHFSSFVLSVPE